MKVYLVWEIEHSIPFDHTRLKGIYASRESADKICAELNATEGWPIEADEYGPMSGTEFKVYENEVEP